MVSSLLPAAFARWDMAGTSYALSIRNCRQGEKMAPRSHGEQEKLLQALIDIGQELASTIELDELLNRILRISREVFRFENAIIRLLDADRQTLVTAAAYGYDEAVIRPEIKLGHGVMGKVAQTGKKTYPDQQSRHPPRLRAGDP
jgi:transcriptional regulator with GAF, ATPase, and Fis domain